MKNEMGIALFKEYQISTWLQHEMVTGGPCLALIKDVLSGWRAVKTGIIYLLTWTIN